MRRTILIAALCVTSIFLYFTKGFAQSYIPFPTEPSSVWRVGWGTSDCFLNGQAEESIIYRIEHDTIIGSEVYGAVYRLGICQSCCPPPFPPTERYIGAIRNDTINRKVLIIPEDSLTDKLYFDFSLSVGDTVNSYYKSIMPIGCVDPLLIVATDSMLLNDGLYHRRVYLGPSSAGCYGSEFVEGVGSLFGFVEAFQVGMEATGRLECFNQYGANIYDSGLHLDDCFLTLSDDDIEITLTDKTFLFYDELEEAWKLNFGTKSTRRYIILEAFDTVGRLTFSDQFNSPTQTFNLSERLNCNGFILIRVSSVLDNGKKQQEHFKLIP